jgi:hypothetical protein
VTAALAAVYDEVLAGPEERGAARRVVARRRRPAVPEAGKRLAGAHAARPQ